jgi:hypothetical protein
MSFIFFNGSDQIHIHRYDIIIVGGDFRNHIFFRYIDIFYAAKNRGSIFFQNLTVIFAHLKFCDAFFM